MAIMKIMGKLKNSIRQIILNLSHAASDNG